MFIFNGCSLVNCNNPSTIPMYFFFYYLFFTVGVVKVPVFKCCKKLSQIYII